MPTGTSPIREPVEQSPREVRVNIGTGKECRVNFGGSAREARVDFQGAREVRADFAGSREIRANFLLGKEVRADFLPYTAREARVNFVQGREVRANFLPITAREVRANFGDAYSGPPPPNDGNPDAHGPPTFRGGVYVGSGRMSFSCDFEVSFTWQKDGFGYSGGLGIGTGLLSGVGLEISDTGQCQAKVSGPACFYTTNPTFNTPPSPYAYDTGPGVGEPVYGWHGSAENDTVVLLPGEIPINNGDVVTVSGSYSCWIDVDEYQDFEIAHSYDGSGEPYAGKYATGYAFNQMQWGFSLSVNTRWGLFAGPPAPNFPYVSSGTFGVGERYLTNYNYNGIPGWRNPGDISGIVYDMIPGYVKCEASATIGWALNSSEQISDSNALPPHGDRAVNVSVSNIQFNSGPWHPLPYSGQQTAAVYASNPPVTALNVGTGFINSLNCGFEVEAASETSAHIVGNIYFGDDLAPGTQQIVFSNVSGPPTGIPNGFQYGAANNVTLDVVNGAIDTYVPQIRSLYHMQRSATTTSPKFWNPDLPNNRDDYQANGAWLVPVESTDSSIRLLDDYAWSPTTFAHAKKHSLTTFADVSGWTAQHGTAGHPTPPPGSAVLPGLQLHATADNFVASSPAALNWDCRNYRYLHVTCTSDIDGADLILEINGSRDPLAVTTRGTVYTSIAPLKTGNNVAVFDLCHPDVLAVSITHTGWDTDPDPIYGVHTLNDFDIRGLKNGQTVTISEMSLERHDDKTPGVVFAEASAGDAGTGFESYWYTPDVAIPNPTCVLDTAFNADAILAEWTQTPAYNHHVYARLMRTRADGKPAADLPHAIGSYPFGFFPPGHDFIPNNRVKSSERLMIKDWVALVNQQTGLSASAAQNGTPPELYDCAYINAVFLTLDTVVTLPDPKNPYQRKITLTPHSPYDDVLGPLQCRVTFNTIRNYPGQISRAEYMFLKRTGCVNEGLVVNPYGGSCEGIAVNMQDCRGSKLSKQTAKTDHNGYFRFKAEAVGLAVIGTDIESGTTVWHERSNVWIGLAGGNHPAQGCLAVDSARGWLHVGNMQKVQTFDLTSADALFTSDDYPDIDWWKQMQFVPRYGTLLMLGLKANAGDDPTKTTFTLWQSQDGGQSGSLVETMVHNSSVIEKDSESGMVFWLYEDANPNDTTLDHKVYVRTSTDGGSSFGDGVVAMFVQDVNADPVPLQAVLLDTVQDARASGQLVMLCQMGSNTRILQSLTKGVDWTVKLTV